MKSSLAARGRDGLGFAKSKVPATRNGAQRLGLVTLEQMLNALTCAVQNPATGIRTPGVPEIRRAAP